MKDNSIYKEMLDYIDPAALNYQDWINVGMALKEEGCPFEWWDDWSAQEDRYRPGECFKKWKSFESSGVTGGTLQYIAEQFGYSKPMATDNFNISGTGINEDGSLAWDAVIHFEEKPIVDKSWVSREELKEPTEYTWDPVDQVITYLSTLFRPEEYIGYVMQSRSVGEGDKQKYIPANIGVYTLQAGQIIDELRTTHDISKAMGDYNPQAGAWIRFNPLDGMGAMDKNVTDYRYALVECDNMELGMQVAMLRELQIPIAVMLYSGGKSVHAIVKVDAPSKSEYKRRVDFLYEICKKNGFRIDTQNKNESRLSRLPGVIRGNHKQYIIDTNTGMGSWEEWKEYIDSMSDDLPEQVTIADYWKNRPEQDPEIISGILRRGRIMLVGGQSKVGKTNLVMQLALAIANGWEWAGKQCVKGKILYLNYEIPEATFNERLELMCRRKGYEVEEVTKNFDVIHLRNYFSDNADRHVNSIVMKFKRKHYDALFIDPLYKLSSGEDENSASEMSKLCFRFGKIASSMNCAVIVVHHFAKGDSSKKESMDRFSGSGMLARYADALITLNTNGVVDGDKLGCYLEGTLREYSPLQKIYLWYDFPIHVIDDSGTLKYAKSGSSQKKSADDNLKDWAEKLHFGFNMLTQDKQVKEVSQPELCKWMLGILNTGDDIRPSQRIAFVNRFKEAVNKGYTYLVKVSDNRETGRSAVFRIDPEAYKLLTSNGVSEE